MRKKKNEKIDYSKVRKEVSQTYYNHDKIFFQYISALNKCESKAEVVSFRKLADGFKKMDAPDELVEYLESSIQNKLKHLEVRYNIDIFKLRAISNYHQ